MNSKTQTKKKSTIYRTGNVTDNRTSSKEGGQGKIRNPTRVQKHTHVHTHKKEKSTRAPKQKTINRKNERAQISLRAPQKK